MSYLSLDAQKSKRTGSANPAFAAGVVLGLPPEHLSALQKAIERCARRSSRQTWRRGVGRAKAVTPRRDVVRASAELFSVDSF
jgi:hypothetical protein